MRSAGLLAGHPVLSGAPAVPLDIENFITNESPLTTTDTRGLQWLPYSSALFGASGGYAGVTSGPLAVGGNGDMCTVDEGISDGVFTAIIDPTLLGSQKGAGLAFRIGAYSAGSYPSPNGYWVLIIKNLGATSLPFYVQRYDNNVYTSIYAGSLNLGVSTPRMLRVAAKGTTVICEVRTSDGLQLSDSIIFTDSLHTTRTRTGFVAYNNPTGSYVVDQWSCYSDPSGLVDDETGNGVLIQAEDNSNMESDL